MAGVALVNPKYSFTDALGAPLVGGTLDVYLAGTTTRSNTWQDKAQTTLNTNPIVLDARGECTLWADDTLTYKFVLKTAAGVTLWTEDNISGWNVSGTLVTFTQAGTGAVGRTAQNKMREWVSLLDFGATGDGSASDSAALDAAMTAHSGKVILLPDPPVAWKFTQAHTIPTNTTLMGMSKQSTKVLKAFNGDLFTLGTGAALEHLYIDGQGATYTGKGVKILGTTSKQRIDHCRIIEMDDNCIYFEKDAGSQFSSIDLEAYRRNAGTSTGRYAVAVEDVMASSAMPRKFVNYESGGTCSFSFGGAANFYIGQSFLGDLAYSSNSRAVFIIGSRQANQAALTISGNNHTIVGGDVNPQITLALNADNCVIGPNSYNTLPIIDNSGNSRNLIYAWNQTYTPTLGSGGVAPSLGDGTLTGHFQRNGAETRVTINLTLGATTSLGTGGLTFTLPQQRHSTEIAVGGTVLISDSSTGLFYAAGCLIAGNDTKLQLIRDTTGSVTFNSPITFATGDTIRVDMTYSN
jgi:hypothetical protein